MSDGPKKLIDAVDPLTMQETDAFGDRQRGVMGQKVQRGSKVKVTCKIVHDDGIAYFDHVKKKPVPGSRSAGHYVIVSVESQVKPGLEMNGEIPFDAGNAREMRRAVQLLAGSCAERLCEKYNDQIDPGECAKAASEAWTDVMTAVQNLPG